MRENKLKSWIKAHKSELIFAGSIIITTVGAILLVKKGDSVKKIVVKQMKMSSSQSLEDIDKTPTISDVICTPTIKTIDVREHLRNLPNGYHPSALKLTEASDLGIELLENQTIVSSHSRCYAA